MLSQYCVNLATKLWDFKVLWLFTWCHNKNWSFHENRNQSFYTTILWVVEISSEIISSWRVTSCSVRTTIELLVIVCRTFEPQLYRKPALYSQHPLFIFSRIAYFDPHFLTISPNETWDKHKKNLRGKVFSSNLEGCKTTLHAFQHHHTQILFKIITISGIINIWKELKENIINERLAKSIIAPKSIITHKKCAYLPSYIDNPPIWITFPFLQENLDSLFYDF